MYSITLTNKINQPYRTNSLRTSTHHSIMFHGVFSSPVCTSILELGTKLVDENKRRTSGWKQTSL